MQEDIEVREYEANIVKGSTRLDFKYRGKLADRQQLAKVLMGLVAELVDGLYDEDG